MCDDKDLFEEENEECLNYAEFGTGIDSIVCPRCQKELFSQEGVVDCAYDDCPNLSEYSDLLGLE